jgi:hypothetical protein
VKHFAWGLAHNSLPLNEDEKQQRHGYRHCVCPIRSRDLDEDAGHLFLKCKYAKMVWRELGMEDKRERLAPERSAMETFRTVW